MEGFVSRTDSGRVNLCDSLGSSVLVCRVTWLCRLTTALGAFLEWIMGSDLYSQGVCARFV